MRFAHPEVLWLMLLLPLAALFAWARLKAGSRALQSALSPAMIERLTAHLVTRRRLGGVLLLLLTCLFLILGSARPQRGTQYVTAARRGIDCIVALDLSESMLAEDLKPNRLLRARHEIAAIIDQLEGDRIGLVAFAGAAFVQCPLTLDYAAARMFLEFMGPDLLPEPGTSIAEALRVSTKAFDTEGDGFKAVILISDGEDHIGEVEDAARDARKAGVRVFSVGIGSSSGEPIPIRDEEGDIEGYKKDREGKVILSRLGDAGLRKIAEITGGLYVQAGGSLGLDRVLDEIERMDKKELEGGVRVLYEERYSYFVWPAILLLLAQWWLPLRRRFGRRAGAAIVGLTVLCVTLTGGGFSTAGGQSSPPPAQQQVPVPTPTPMPGGAQPGAPGPTVPGGAPPVPESEGGLSEEEWTRQLEENQVYKAEHPYDPRPLYNLGNLYHLKGDLPQAADFYEIGQSRSEGELASQVAYNFGNTLAKQGKLPDAMNAFVDALRLDPNNEDAKANLELTQLMIDQLSQCPDSS
ncbi:VWA domain-containing protein, partial [Candidatus Eisenbacteria bacterium]